MKKKSYLLAFFCIAISVFSCDKEADLIINQESIIGKWVLTESSYSAGGPQIWESVTDGAEFDFFENGEFSSSLYSECTTGNFFFNTDLNELTLEYNCDGFSSQSQNTEGQIIFHIRFNSNNEFLLSAKTGPICIEGCSSKFIKQ